MEKTRQIINKVARLYSYGTEKKTSEEVFQVNYEKLLDKIDEWHEAFRHYDFVDVENAINQFWRYKSDKSRPNVSQILALLETENEVKKIKPIENRSVEIKNISPAVYYMQRDIDLGRCKHLLPVYEDAVNHIINQKLFDLIDIESRKLCFSDQYNTADKNGLFDNFDDILIEMCKKHHGKSFQFESKMQIQSDSCNNQKKVVDMSIDWN